MESDPKDTPFFNTLMRRWSRHPGCSQRRSWQQDVDGQHPIGIVRHFSGTWSSSLATSCFYTIDAYAGTNGDTLWAQMKTMWFGAPGLIIGAIMLLIAVGGFVRNGFGWSCLVVGVCAVFFLIPGIVLGLQQWAQSVAG